MTDLEMWHKAAQHVAENFGSSLLQEDEVWITMFGALQNCVVSARHSDVDSTWETEQLLLRLNLDEQDFKLAVLRDLDNPRIERDSEHAFDGNEVHDPECEVINCSFCESVWAEMSSHRDECEGCDEQRVCNWYRLLVRDSLTSEPGLVDVFYCQACIDGAWLNPLVVEVS